MNNKIVVLITLSALILTFFPSKAQKIISYNYNFETTSTEANEVQILTDVEKASATSLRLYFKGTELGENSRLILEAADGARQELRKADLKNWNYSSAYFNGSRVKVSLVAAKGERNKIVINGIKAPEAKLASADIKSGASAKREMGTSNGQLNLDDYPYAQAVGRFTDGDLAYVTGWIAENGAIVSEIDDWYFLLEDFPFDIVEFNVPPSNADGTVNHPGPEDQYPLNQDNILSETWKGTMGEFDHIQIKLFGNGSRNVQYGGFAFLEALPNHTGKRPGERQQQSFKISGFPAADEMEGKQIEIFHYGSLHPFDHTKDYTLQKSEAETGNPEKVLAFVKNKDRFLVYNLGTGREGFWEQSYMDGAPITFANTNVAIGIHNAGFSDSPSLGTGFRESGIRQKLSDFFGEDMVFVNNEMTWSKLTGEIDHPYLNVQDGASNAGANAVVSIAKGNYDESVYINNPVVLKAPVGKVVIGEGSASSQFKIASIPSELFNDNNEISDSFDWEDDVEESPLKSFPNPFVNHTEISYALSISGQVEIRVFDSQGNEVKRLKEDEKQPGEYAAVWDGSNHQGKTVPPGVYVIKIFDGAGSTAVKVIKE